MQPGGHCGSRAIAHASFKFRDDWKDIRTSHLNHLESYKKDDANTHVPAARAMFGELKIAWGAVQPKGHPVRNGSRIHGMGNWLRIFAVFSWSTAGG